MKERFTPRSCGSNSEGGSLQSGGTSENNRNAKCYSITKSGRKQIERAGELREDMRGDRAPRFVIDR
jgi:hypothetical protein